MSSSDDKGDSPSVLSILASSNSELCSIADRLLERSTRGASDEDFMLAEGVAGGASVSINLHVSHSHWKERCVFHRDLAAMRVDVFLTSEGYLEASEKARALVGSHPRSFQEMFGNESDGVMIRLIYSPSTGC